MRIALVCAAFVVLVAASARGEVIERVVAVVNDEIILQSDVGREPLERLIEAKLVEQDARARALSVSPQEIERALAAVRARNQLDEEGLREAIAREGLTPERYRAQLARALLEQKAISVAVRANVTVSDEDVRARYEQEARAHALEPLEQVKEELKRQLESERLEAATRAWLRELRARAYVEVR